MLRKRRNRSDHFLWHPDFEDEEGGDIGFGSLLSASERKGICYYLSCNCFCDRNIELSKLYKDIFNLYPENNPVFDESPYFEKVPHNVFKDLIH